MLRCRDGEEWQRGRLGLVGAGRGEVAMEVREAREAEENWTQRKVTSRVNGCGGRRRGRW